MVTDGMYLLFIPGMTILAFIIGTALAFVAMSAKQEPTGDEPSETEAAH
jgi:hypothetical protein